MGRGTRPLGNVRTLRASPMAPQPQSVHGVWGSPLRELPNGRGLCPTRPGRVAAIVESDPPVLDHPGVSHGLLLGMLRPLGMDVHLPRTCARHVRSALRSGRGSTAPGDRGTGRRDGGRLPPEPNAGAGSTPDRGRRPRGRRRIVTQVHVNVNDLVDQVRKAGIATDYTCPACRGHIHITGETTLATLRNCQYCGSVVQTTDLVDFLTKVVGYQ